MVRTAGLVFVLGAGALLCLLALPLLALLLSAAPADVLAGLRHPLFSPAILLSLRTSAVSLSAIVATGTPLAWWLSRARGPHARAIEIIVDLPIVMPPAVMGLALLLAFGRNGLVGSLLWPLGLSLPFTELAVMTAQVVVAAPFYVQASANAFRKVDPDLILVARTLGASPTEACLRVAVPLASPGLIAGASLAWARALGEFGATLLFAGNLRETTQTMPLAIYAALETDLRAALSLSLCLFAVAAVLLLSLRAGPSIFPWHRPSIARQVEPR